MINWKLKWLIDNKTATFTLIPERMREKDLYFMILMYSKDDEVEIDFS